MSRRIDLPSDHTVRQTLAELLHQTTTEGTKPTVVELANRLGLTNSTFWRHFPDIAHELRAGVHTPAPDATTSPTTQRLAELDQRNTELSRDNRRLTEYLDLTAINIRRLTLDNHNLRQALESANAVTRIDTKTRTP